MKFMIYINCNIHFYNFKLFLAIYKGKIDLLFPILAFFDFYIHIRYHIRLIKRRIETYNFITIKNLNNYIA